MVKNKLTREEKKKIWKKINGGYSPEEVDVKNNKLEEKEGNPDTQEKRLKKIEEEHRRLREEVRRLKEMIRKGGSKKNESLPDPSNNLKEGGELKHSSQITPPETRRDFFNSFNQKFGEDVCSEIEVVELLEDKIVTPGELVSWIESNRYANSSHCENKFNKFEFVEKLQQQLELLREVKTKREFKKARERALVVLIKLINKD